MKCRVFFLVKTLTPVLAIIILFAGFSPGATIAQDVTQPEVRLAYIHNNVVKLADAEGSPIYTTGPEFQSGQGATLFWSPDGERLYISRRNGFFVTGAGGGAAVQLPGNYGLTVIYDRTGQVLYYMESTSPAEGNTPELVTFPLRELNTALQQGGTGRLVDYIGQYASGSAQVVLNTAALQYARHGGLLGAGRPRLFPTYGNTLFYSCCFPSPGLSLINVTTGEKIISYDTSFIPGAAAVNSSRSRLAGPTTEGTLRIIDLITEGQRDYAININGTIERVIWSLDDSHIYLAVRTTPQIPLELNPILTTTVDTRSARIAIWRLDLVTGQTRQLADLGDFYGVSSIAATRDYVFVVVVERNTQLVSDLNAGFLPENIDPNDARLFNEYLPGTILFRIDTEGQETLSIMTDVWGISARPLVR